MEAPEVVHLLPQLDEQLISLLQSLTREEWQAQTIAKLWKVKDVAAHLLDGNIRILSMLRDGYFGEQTTAQSYEAFVQYLNGLNADWVKAMKRVSPQMLVLLHQVTGPLYCKYYASLSPDAVSPFAVGWMGETVSTNRTHIAREYTEKWLHQQQIREAIGKPGLMTKAFFYPFISTFMLGLPYTYRNIPAPDSTVIQITVSTDISGTWFIVCNNQHWQLVTSATQPADAQLTIDPDSAWKLFSKSIRPEQVRDKVMVLGNKELALKALEMVSAMA